MGEMQRRRPVIADEKPGFKPARKQQTVRECCDIVAEENSLLTNPNPSFLHQGPRLLLSSSRIQGCRTVEDLQVDLSSGISTLVNFISNHHHQVYHEELSILIENDQLVCDFGSRSSSDYLISTRVLD
ncbi:hypothetical protein C5167_026286 [Papaver somniferum]|nr:hypothetical protein C5167_026286 [Papaver somniferum]